MSNVNRRVPRPASIPWLIIGIAIIHTVYAFVALAGTWGDIVQDGVVNSVSGDPEREAALWFFYAGIGFMAIGTFAHRAIRTTGRLPLQVGVYLLLIGGTMVVIQPASGGFLVLVAGLLALAAARLTPADTP
ncbi:DUF6463 family protein [Actinomadura rudentiformis]|uniref:Uncharacterized protein n=1 Tax=Actinomadura rudentiformis TaxID=359158 RepID=A0A6H9YVS7_9ACTN|nr:DUF6463 family protein [Actinomadura rudentiformis]KAB2352671.1 hypothetical protein F8566_03235 [Actinomadura rudentiformis]